MIITKSFKYDTEHYPEIHKKISSLTKMGRGGEFSDYVRELIERDCQGERENEPGQGSVQRTNNPDHAELEKLRNDVKFLIGLVQQMTSSGRDWATSPGNENTANRELIEIVETLEEVAAAPETREVNREEIRSKLKSRFKLE